MRFSSIPCALLITLFFISCSQPKKETVETPEEQALVEEAYALNGQSATVKWTAYKFTERAGVSGTFDSVTSATTMSEGTLQELLQNATFTIETRSVNSQLQLRDDRIYNAFFTTIGAETITGEFVAVDEGAGQVLITLGEQSGQADFSYSHAQDTLVITSTIDLVSWKAEEGVTALNEVCKDGHTGADGVSKLWPDVNIEVKVPVKKL